MVSGPAGGPHRGGGGLRRGRRSGQPRLRRSDGPQRHHVRARPAISTCTSPTACTGAPTPCADRPGRPRPSCCGPRRRMRGLDEMRAARTVGRSVVQPRPRPVPRSGPAGPGLRDRRLLGRRRPGGRGRGVRIVDDGTAPPPRPGRSARDRHPTGRRAAVALVRSRRPEPVAARLTGGPRPMTWELLSAGDDRAGPAPRSGGGPGPGGGRAGARRRAARHPGPDAGLRGRAPRRPGADLRRGSPDRLGPAGRPRRVRT